MGVINRLAQAYSGFSVFRVSIGRASITPKQASAKGSMLASGGCDTLLFLEGGQMPQGTIKKIVSEKGFGFIGGDKGDVFFHHSAVEGGDFETLQIGQAVTYEEGHGPKGPRAENVRPAD